ncbi:SAM-dependent methyltransferase [Actinomadura darangshiensis]|uniref:SAM-dependent methyltransferase n=1 Tax=Actinomadura darangshiensis TaxID=705336 RepID=A0A4R5B9Q9_9ACTN|nr:SAM-dependent methyltransferase [Actinomadura darangshiensis]TDD80444.1 SAM-dependent methyltransferase [Actinomadura darangshiensis]
MTEDRHRRSAAESAVAELDTGVPHIARVYDYLLGGKDNFAVDREAGDEFARTMPSILLGVRECRKFLARAVEYLTADCGIRQFLDIGTGLPTADNIHEVAQRTAPDSRVVYVDNDPMVLVHARALLTSSKAGETAYIDADLRDIDQVLDTARETLDFSRPVAVMLVGVLHCVPDESGPLDIVRRLLAAVPSGSYLVLGHPASDIEVDATASATSGLNDKLSEPVTFRTHDQVARFLDDVELVEPGIVQYSQWRPAPGSPPLGPVSAWCAVARKA